MLFPTLLRCALDIDNNKVMGKNIFSIFRGFKPKDVITINSYSLDSLAKVITNDTKNDIGAV